jgi:hypothetical protein
MRYSFLIKNDKNITGILETLGLLGIGVYNDVIESVVFYFNGFKGPLLLSKNEMKVNEADAVMEMSRLLGLMLKKGII